VPPCEGAPRTSYTDPACWLDARSRALKAAFSAISVFLCGCAATLDRGDALTVVPYELQDSGRIVVDVWINGRGPLPFALDTAASISFVFDTVRDALGLEAEPDVSANVHGVVASGRFPLVEIDRLQLGRETWSDARLVSLPGETEASSTLAGILGIDFLRRYGVAFSTQDRVVLLYSPDVVSSRAYRGWASVPLEPRTIRASSEPLFFFEVEIGGNAVPALFDLGAGLNVINRPGARFLRLVPGPAEKDTVLSDVFETAPVLARMGSQEVATARVRWRNEQFLIADLEIFSTLMREDSPLAILGSGLFNQRDFVIDFTRNRLLVRVAMDEADDAP
jgi:hypothetical protein